MAARVVASIVGAALFIGALTLLMSCGTVPQSEIGFQVGGGPFDAAKRKVKSDLLVPGRHVLGPMDKVWLFPSNKTLRFQDFEGAVTTVDGKKVIITGQVAFRFVGEKDPKLARDFAEGLGSRKYDGARPGEDGQGWENMLNQLVVPEINATMKDGIGRVYCADFEPACRSIDPRGTIPASDPERVYDELSAALSERVNAKLGAPYLQDIRIRVQKISLPTEVQSNIDRVTAEQAKTKAAEQAAHTASAEAKAIRIRGKALKRNPQQIAIEVAKECHGGDSCTIIVDGSGRGVVPSVSAGK